MFDLGKEKTTIDCPSCNRKHTVTLLQVANRSIVFCPCGTNIQLEDKGGSARRGIQSVNDSMKKLNDMFKKFGK